MVFGKQAAYQRLPSSAFPINIEEIEHVKPSVLINNKILISTLVLCGLGLTILIYANLFVENRLISSPDDYCEENCTNAMYYENTEPARSILTASTIKSSDDVHYLVSSPKCKMIDLEPFNEEAMRFHSPNPYKPCTNLGLLTYVEKTAKGSVVRIQEDLVPLYSPKGVTCCYSSISRPIDIDNVILSTACKEFHNNISLLHDAIKVNCVESNTNNSVYENVHISVTPTETARMKMKRFDQYKKPLSVLLVGIDSVSRLNLIRSMPETYKFLEEGEGWVPLKGYNKVADNTFPNLMAILTGFNLSYSYKTCNPRDITGLDECPMVWYDYRDLGFITAYAEDEAEINTFNYLKEGFSVPPTDYYFRPYFMATENLKGDTNDAYCTGPEVAGERVLNLAKDFSTTFKAYPTFGFFWMNSFSHDLINSPSGMDQKVKAFLYDLHQEGINQDSIIIFLSDHGMRFGDIRLTLTGWLEERLPFVYVSFPKWFQEEFPTEFNNFKANTNKLTCPYDLHMTLQHIISLTDPSYKVTQANACPLCHSLFDQIDSDRSCRDAGITQHWCSCTGYKETKLDTKLETNALNFILDEIRDTIRKYDGESSCRNYTVSKILSTRVSQPLAHDKTTYFYFLFETEPKADFETTVFIKGDQFQLTGGISRLDRYAKTSRCVANAELKKYCYCY